MHVTILVHETLIDDVAERKNARRKGFNSVSEQYCTGQLIPQASPRSPRLLFADAERPTIERRDGKI